MKPTLLIGQNATVSGSRNACLVGMAGTIVDETKNTFIFAASNACRTIHKRGNRFIIGGASFDGEAILQRAHEHY